MTWWWGADSGRTLTVTRTAGATTRRSADCWGVAGRRVSAWVLTMSVAARIVGVDSRLPGGLR
jgi:hypothetical protein